MPLPNVKDSRQVITVGRVADFQPRLMRDGAAIDLTGKTVTATMRRESDPGTTLGAAWENMAVTLGNNTYTAAQGGVRIAKELLASAFATPASLNASAAYVIEFYVVEDDYSPRPCRIGVTRGLRA